MSKSEIMPESILPYLNEISDRIWSERAAVMVGAGFSKNAGEGFPDWSQLGDLFFEKAYGRNPQLSDKNYLNVLKLADEVQAAIGRPALEHLLRSNIPDTEHAPAELHVKLLEFPWVDVFTTNYDTLLERASSRVINHRYEPVVNKEDLPYAMQPRIVKLHGSFPSERPFIITEEDYRRYPYDYAPFVNTVQQSLLENTFCLIGFSGDDPNFFKWIGWIRDNLGKNKTQKIYLVGVFDMPTASKNLLNERGITVVDFSCCSDISNNDHKKALERLFDFVNSKKPDAVDWPGKRKNPPYPRMKAQSEDFQRAVTVWREERMNYPGWLILPYPNRQNLWDSTYLWVDKFPESEKAPLGLDIQYMSELIWRLERCLIPLHGKIPEICEQLLDKYWPFHLKPPEKNIQFKLSKVNEDHLPWQQIRHSWLSLALALLRFYRWEGFLEQWQIKMAQLQTVSDNLSAWQKEFIQYETYLFHLFKLNFIEAKRTLENWQPEKTQPYWLSKRITALAEMGAGGIKESEILLNSSLSKTREQNQKANKFTIYSVFTNEAYQMLLYRYIYEVIYWNYNKEETAEEKIKIDQILEKNRSETIINERTTFGSVENRSDQITPDKHKETRAEVKQRLRSEERERQRKNENQRWEELKQYRIDPFNELLLFQQMMKQNLPQRKEFTEQYQFDIGQIKRQHHLHGWNSSSLNAYSFLIFCEEIGLPFKIGNSVMEVQTAESCVQRISHKSLFWATATLVRIGKDKNADIVFNRSSVFRLIAKDADRLIRDYLEALLRSNQELERDQNSFAGRLTQALPEIISRLCCKCFHDTKIQLLDFIIKAYSSRHKERYRGIENLINRLIASLSKAEQYYIIPELLKIPFPGLLNPVVEEKFPNPFLFIEIVEKPAGLDPLNINQKLIDALLIDLESEEIQKRIWAITTLNRLYHLDQLNSKQIDEFGNALWSQLDEHGLPENPMLYKYAYLDLPHPANIDVKQKFKAFVRTLRFPIQKNRHEGRFNIFSSQNNPAHEIIGASNTVSGLWEYEDAKYLLDRLLEWWDHDKEALKQDTDHIIENQYKNMGKIIAAIIAITIGPSLIKDVNNKIESELTRLLNELEDYGVSSSEAEAACIHIFPDRQEKLFGRIENSLISNDIEKQQDAVRAVFRLIIHNLVALYDESRMIPFDLLRQYISWSSPHSINLALLNLTNMIRKKPDAFFEELEQVTLERLSRLLNETKYSNENTYNNFDEKLTVRTYAAELAAALWSYCTEQSITVPKTIQQWKRECNSPDEFAEIRKLWID